jgi:hypothetical protein
MTTKDVYYANVLSKLRRRYEKREREVERDMTHEITVSLTRLFIGVIVRYSKDRITMANVLSGHVTGLFFFSVMSNIHTQNNVQ